MKNNEETLLERGKRIEKILQGQERNRIALYKVIGCRDIKIRSDQCIHQMMGELEIIMKQEGELLKNKFFTYVLRRNEETLPISVCLFPNATIQVIQLKGKNKHLYQFLVPLVMDPDVIHANNNYPFKTSEDFVWYTAIDSRDMVGSIPVEQESGKKAVINNYYVVVVDEKQKEILPLLLPFVITVSIPAGWTFNSVMLIQDQETFEKFELVPMDKKWTHYVKVNR